MNVSQLIAVLEGWDGDLKIVDKDERPVRGARVIQTEDGPKIKLG